MQIQISYKDKKNQRYMASIDQIQMFKIEFVRQTRHNFLTITSTVRNGR